ncbi:MAG TPA: cytochrome c oxidase subunit 3 [Blastocatellia bacterium]
MGTTTVTRPETKVKSGSTPFPGNGHRGNGRPPRGGGGHGPDGPGGDEFQPEKYKIAVWVVLVGVLMLFVALSSAYLVRRTKGLSDSQYFDWVPLSLPRVLWLNTGVILLSSVTLEAARRLLKRGRFVAFNRYITGTAILGVAFLAGQLVAWRQLARQGIYIKSNPHGSFFYLLTCLHGLHLLGGLVAIVYVMFRGWRFEFGPRQDTAVSATSIYWHFMDFLWVYLLVLLFFWR